MRKFYSLLCALLCLSALSASAADWQLTPDGNAFSSRKDAPRRAAEERYYLGYCEGLNDALGTGGSGLVAGAIFIDAETANQFKGNTITAVNIGIGTLTNTNVTIFINTSLPSTISATSVTYMQKSTLEKTTDWNEIALDTPYEIDGKAFYLGYQVRASNTDMPIGIDRVPTNDTKGGWLAIGSNWSNYASQYGTIALQAVLVGDNLPQNDVTITDYLFPSYLKTNTPESISFTFKNQGVKPVQSLEASCTVNGKAVDGITVDLNAPVATGESGSATVKGVKYSDVAFQLPVKVTITKVNGEDDETPANNTFSGLITFMDNTYQRNVVVEEWTDFQCGFCPAGIVGMEYMRNKYGNDGYIGIAVHGLFSGGLDPMYNDAFLGFLNKFDKNNGYPHSIMNRTQKLYPNASELEPAFLRSRALPTLGEITATAVYDETNPTQILVKTNSEFGMNLSEVKYRVALIVIEDHVGPYRQLNYYSGGNYGPMGGWENKPESVSTYYDEVARETSGWRGVANSLPTTLTSGEKYAYNDFVPATTVTDINNAEVVALLLNYDTFEVVNACKVKPVPGDITDTGVDGVEEETLLSVVGANGAINVVGNFTSYTVYTVDGKAVTATSESAVNVPAGIYIVNVNTTNGNKVARKIVVR